MDATAVLPSKTLIPFDRAEAITTKEAAGIAGRCERTIRRWCSEHRIGRHLAGGHWVVSGPALRMLLDADHEALSAYSDYGVRAQFEPVARYFRLAGLEHLLQRPEFGAAA